MNLVGELDGQAVNAELDVLSSNYQMTAATGTIVMPPGTPHAGETICAGGGATRYVGSTGRPEPPNTDYFTFDTLSLGPDCPGPVALAGSIEGCYGENLSSGI